MHRVGTVDDIRSIAKTLVLPQVSNRCRKFNDTHFRCLPNVLFIGASKCGTTSVVDYLSQLPNISFVNRRIHKKDKHREVHRFDRNTFNWALKSIDLADEWASTPIVNSENATVIHYTPHYLYAPTVPYEMKRFYPHATELKFIAMLREPVSRAWSSYWFHNSHLLRGNDSGTCIRYTQLIPRFHSML